MRSTFCVVALLGAVAQLAVCSPLPRSEPQQHMFAPRRFTSQQKGSNNHRVVLRRQTRQQQQAMAEMMANIQKATADVLGSTAAPSMMPVAELSSPAPIAANEMMDPSLMMPAASSAGAAPAQQSVMMMSEANKVQPLMMMEPVAPAAPAATAFSEAASGADKMMMVPMMMPDGTVRPQAAAAGSESSPKMMMVMMPAATMEMMKSAGSENMTVVMMMPNSAAATPAASRSLMAMAGPSADAASQMTMMMAMQAASGANSNMMSNAPSASATTSATHMSAPMSDSLMTQERGEGIAALPGDSLRLANGIPARLDIASDNNGEALAQADRVNIQELYAGTDTSALEQSYGQPDNTVTDTPLVVLPPVEIVREGDMREMLHVLPDEDKQQQIVSNKTINTFSLLQKNISVHHRNTINYLKTLNVNTDYVLNIQRVNHPKTEVNTLVHVHNRYVPKLIVKHTRTDRIKELPAQVVPQIVEQQQVEELPPVVETVQIEREGYTNASDAANGNAGSAALSSASASDATSSGASGSGDPSSPQSRLLSNETTAALATGNSSESVDVVSESTAQDALSSSATAAVESTTATAITVASGDGFSTTKMVMNMFNDNASDSAEAAATTTTTAAASPALST